MPGVNQSVVILALCSLVFEVNAATNTRVKRDGAHHHGHSHGHGNHGGSFGFHGFGPQYNQPLIIEEASRISADRSVLGSSYGYRPPSQSYGPPPPVGPRPGGIRDNGGHHGVIGVGRDQHGVIHPDIPDFVGGGVCPIGCVPAGDFDRAQDVPSTHYGPPLPIYADFNGNYPQNVVDEEEKKPPSRVDQVTPRTPRPTPKPTTTTTPASSGDSEEATLPPFITDGTLNLARTFGFDIVPGDGTPPSQDELDEVLALLPPGLSFSLLPMDIQDAYFSGEIKLKKLGDKEKKQAQNKLALEARKAAARN